VSVLAIRIATRRAEEQYALEPLPRNCERGPRAVGGILGVATVLS